MDAIERLGRDVDCGLESEGDVCAVEVVIDGFGDSDAVESLVGDLFGDGHGPIASDDDEGVDLADLEVGDADVGEVLEDGVALLVFADREVLRVGSVVGSDDGSALGEDIGDVIEIESPDSVLDESEETVFNSEDLDAVVDRVFGDGSDDRVESRAVPTAGEDGDAFDDSCRR